MKYSFYNRFQPLLAKHNPDGLSARLEAFVNAPPVASTQDGNPPVDPPVKTPDAKPDPSAADAGDKPNPDPNLNNEEEEEEEFPQIGKLTPEKKEEGLDEKEFDSETERAVEGMEEKAGEKFKALRAELKALKKKEFKPDPESIPEFTALKAEVEELRKAKEERDGLKTRLESVMKKSDELAVKESPDFIARVTKPISDMTEAISALAGAAGMEAADLMAIIAEPDPGKQDKALSALEAKVPRRTLSRLERFCDDYKVIEQAEAEILADIPKSAAEARRQQQEAQEESRRAVAGQFKSATKTSFTQYAHTIPGFVDSSGALTATAKAACDAAVSIDPHELAPEDLGFMIFASKALPAARKAIKALEKEVAALKSGTSTPIPGNPPPKPKPSSDEPPKGQGLSDRMKGQSFTFNPGLVG